MSGSRVSLTLGSVVVFSLVAGSVSAQSNSEIHAGTQFNFSTPGARSLGLGGAFVGLADDATAAFTNPAGLTILTRPEVSAEGRNWDFTNEFTDRGHAFGAPTNRGVDTIAGLQTVSADSDTSGISFLSFVYPRENWAIAVYRHELANFETSTQVFTQGPFFDALNPQTGDLETFRVFPAGAELELLIEGIGVSGAVQLGETFSLGLGVSRYDFEIDAFTVRFGFPLGNATAPGGRFGPPDISSAAIANGQFEEGSDEDIGFNLGFLWHFGDRWSLGGVYRQGPEFEYEAENLPGPLGGFDPVRQTAQYKVPDVYGLGIAFRPSDATLLTLDYNRVTYSDLRATISIFREPDDPAGEGSRAAARRISGEDGDELHLGFEQVLFRARFPVALRLGAWHDPDHALAFQGQPGEDGDSRAAAALFRGGDDEIHYSVGFGLVFGQRFQLDAAYDTSDTIDTASLSAVYRF